jgi:glutamine cyclotransferase
MKNANPLSTAARIFHGPLVTGLLSLAAAGFAGCGRNPPSARALPDADPAAMQRESATARVPIYTYEVVNAWPHDRGAFTEGLVYLKGILIESTGLNGASSLRKVDLRTGRVLQEISVPAEYFGEGAAVLDGKIFQLTWRNQKGFIYDLDSLTRIGEFSYSGEGWGLTTDGQSLIMSDGTNQIRFLDPVTFQVIRTIGVFSQGQPLKMLNELEYIKGEIFANVWQTQLIVRIDPATGRLLGVIDFSGLLRPEDRDEKTDVLNGIAYDAADDRIFVTGKNWPKLFEVRLRLK